MDWNFDLGGFGTSIESCCLFGCKVGRSGGAVLSVDIPGLGVDEQLCQLGVAAGCLRLKPELWKRSLMLKSTGAGMT